MKVGSDTLPDKVKLLQGKKLVSFNVESYVETGEDGVEQTKYTYQMLKLPVKYTGSEITQAVNKEKRAVVDASIKALTEDYCDGEVGSFWVQETEARAYAADDSVATPFLTQLATSRGIELTDLVNKVLSNADALALATAVLLGKYQASLSEEF